MNRTPFRLRTETDLIDTFRENERPKVLLPTDAHYPHRVENYYTWNEPSGVYTYLVYKRSDWEIPKGLVLQKNGHGSSQSPAGMCSWCHHTGPSDEVGLMTTMISTHASGGTWLCLDLSCLEKISARAGKDEKKLAKLSAKFFQ